MSLFSLEGKVVVVFGGAGYIGRALVAEILDLGGKVLVADRSGAAFDGEAAKPVRRHPDFSFIECDVASSGDVAKTYGACLERFGGLTGMVNLVAYGKFDQIARHTDEDMACAFDGVAGQVFRTIREVIPFFKAGGAIVTTASMYGIVSPDYRIYGESGQNNPALYGMGKAAVIQLTKYAAAHLAPLGIRVNCVAPGPVPDPAKNPPADFLERLAAKTMLGRVGTPKEMAGAFLYLLSDAASFTTGECIEVDGGWTKW
jgi:gluconate 5-dehydrogenase